MPEIKISTIVYDGTEQTLPHNNKDFYFDVWTQSPRVGLKRKDQPTETRPMLLEPQHDMDSEEFIEFSWLSNDYWSERLQLQVGDEWWIWDQLDCSAYDTKAGT